MLRSRTGQNCKLSRRLDEGGRITRASTRGIFCLDSVGVKTYTLCMRIRLREVREAKGMSLRTLGEKAGVNWTAVHRIEKGKDPLLSTLAKLAKALGVKVKTLIDE